MTTPAGKPNTGPFGAKAHHTHILVSCGDAAEELFLLRKGRTMLPDDRAEAIALVFGVAVEEIETRPDGKFAVPLNKARRNA